MKEFKGTKGKWTLHPHASACVCLKGGRVIANCGGYCNSIEFERIAAENESNAKLISAAPELLNACIEALKYVSVEEPAYHTLHAAIDKALK